MTDVFGRLVRYARTRPDLPPPCYRIRRIDWVLDIRQQDGRAVMTIEPYDATDAIPTMRRSSPKPMPMLAVDSAAYVLGQHGDGITADQAAARTRAFWAQMGLWMTSEHTHPAVGAGIALAQMHGRVDSPNDVSARSIVAVRVAGIWLHRLPEACARWVAIVERAKGSGRRGVCVACGETKTLAASLPNGIPSHLIPGGEHEVQLTVLPKNERGPGASLPVCVACGDMAAGALQALLEDPTRTARRPGQDSATVVFGLGLPAADAAAVAILDELGVR